MRLPKTILSFFILLSTITKSQTIIDTALLNHSDKWKPKISLLDVAGILKKVSLGPMETVNIDKGEKNITRTKEKSLQSENGAWGIVKDYTTEKKQHFDVTVLYNGNDSVFLNMKMVTFKEGHTTVFSLSKKQLPESGGTSVYCEETLIQTKIDSTQWLVTGNTVTVWNAYDVALWNIISSRGDTISIHPAKGFRKQVYKMSLAEGIVFVRKGQQIAAYQQAPRFLWLRKDLSENYKQIIGAAVISILSDFNNGY